jgi:F0F1-type ATP synthase gamma subunit
MSRALAIERQIRDIETIGRLTEVFEGIASIHLASIRDSVIASEAFFAQLWPIYQSLRIKPQEQMRRAKRTKKGRNVIVVVTGEEKFGAQTSEAITNEALHGQACSESRGETHGETHSANTDIIAVGTRGAVLLTEAGARPVKQFIFPASDIDAQVAAIVQELYDYDRITVFYQTYQSLRLQQVTQIDLISSIREQGDAVQADQPATIDSGRYLFEPSVSETADYMEAVMMHIAFLQIIMEAKLAGYASRFNAMDRAKKRAEELAILNRQLYHRTKRSESDERVKEIMRVVKRHGHARTY